MQPSKVLVIDDSTLMHKLFGALLPKANLIHALDGIEALSRLAEHPDADLVILDINMPRMNGLEFLRQVKFLLPCEPWDRTHFLQIKVEVVLRGSGGGLRFGGAVARGLVVERVLRGARQRREFGVVLDGLRRASSRSARQSRSPTRDRAPPSGL